MDRRFDDIEETLPRQALGQPAPSGRGAALLYVAFLCDTPLEAPSRHLLDRLASVTLGRGRIRTVQRDVLGQRLELLLPDPWTSTEHAQLLRSGAGWLIEDRGSRNGVRVNGQSVATQVLSDGDLI